MIVADLDHDQHPDLATANAYGNSVTVLLGKANGDFTRPPDSPTKVRSAPRHQAAVSANSLAVEDFDSDGRDDLAVTDDGSADSTDVAILLQR